MELPLNYQDPSERMLEVDQRLQIEVENVEWLKEKMKQSEELTTGMSDILTSFEHRLAKLEETILPIYQDTENLQRRQENIDNTLEAMDHVISFYNVSKEVEPIIREGPSNVDLDAFLHAMSRLKGALDYFENNNPQSIELENVKTLYGIGGNALSREFREMINKHSVPIPPSEILGSIATAELEVDDDLVSIHNFPEEVQLNMIQVAEWLNLNDHEEYMNIYATVRGSVARKSLDHLRDYQRSGSGRARTSPTMMKKFSSPMADGTPTTGNKKISRLQTSINRRFSNVSTRLEAATGYSIPGRKSLGSPIIEDQVGEFEVELFMLSVSALQRIMASEQKLMVGIIPHQYQKKIFEMIIRDSIDLVVADGETIISRVKKGSSNNDFMSVMIVFQVVRHLMNLKPSMDRTLEGCDATVRSKYNNMNQQFINTGMLTLDGFIEAIKTDGTTKEKMPKDGTVFQLTSNVILFLEQLLDYIDTISMILTQDTSYNQTLIRLPRKISVSERGPALVGIYIRKVLVQLNYTLVNKSDFYSDHFLKAIFRLNNSQYILRSVKRTGLVDIVSLANPDFEDTYNEMILEQKRLYAQSWQRVLDFIWSMDDIPVAILQAPGKLNDKYCRMIKDKFVGFNREMDDISNTQRSYSIPDVELRESLKRDNKEYILPKYNSFYEKYAGIPFTKHVDKYVKYTPAQVSAAIDSFFDAAA